MKRLLRRLFVLFFLALIFFFALGYMARHDFEGQVTQTYQVPIEQVWEVLTDLDELPNRRKEIVKLEMVEANAQGLASWKEYTDMGGYILFEYLEKVDYEKLVVNMKESTFGMSGTWTYQLTPHGKGTQLTIIEHSRIDNIMVRSMMTLTGRSANLYRELEMIEKALEPDGLVKARIL